MACVCQVIYGILTVEKEKKEKNFSMFYGDERKTDGERYRLAALNALLKERIESRTEEEAVRALLALSLGGGRVGMREKEKIGA